MRTTVSSNIITDREHYYLKPASAYRQAGFEWLLSFRVKTRGSLSIVIQLTVQVIGIDNCVYDYGLAESNPHFIMDCKCGNSNCRKTITGNDL